MFLRHQTSTGYVRFSRNDPSAIATGGKPAREAEAGIARLNIIRNWAVLPRLGSGILG
jgi:hypothetical protein